MAGPRGGWFPARPSFFEGQPDVARFPRRFRLWPVNNMLGVAADLAFIDGVVFPDGMVVLRVPGRMAGVFTFADRSLDQILGMELFASPPRVEWIDGAHEQ